jgi:peptide deformylase
VLALRNIRKDEDPILRKISKEVPQINTNILELLDDMAQTMEEANGVGLAAVQVGVLKRVMVIDVGEGLIELINPKLVETFGEQIDAEGCLSLPGLYGEVKRPKVAVVEALDRFGKKITVRGEALLARALCHELDHLDGILFKDKVIRFVDVDAKGG